MKQPLLFALLGVLCGLLCPGLGLAQATSAPANGLVAQFSFDESRGTTAQDATGQLNAASPIGGAWRPTGGYDGRGALDLPGAAHVNIPLYWQPQTFTVAFWLFPKNLSDYSQRVRATAGWDAFFFHSAANGQLYVGTDVGNRIVLGPNVVQAGSWQHYVFTFDKGVGAIYQNGVLLGRRTDMRLPTAWGGMAMGETGDALYDELRIYNRSLSAQEVSSLFTYRQYLPQNNPNANTDHNWTLERSFDGNDNVVAESKQFTDALGRPTQAQARNAATQQVFAAQTIYNTGGQPVLQTLAAPIDNQSFNYKEGFITAGSSPYGPTKFEGSTGYAPEAVDATSPGTLGYYFSKQNAQEPLTPVTSYPYSLVEPYEGPLGGTKRAAGPGDELRMGKGREAKGRDFPVRLEFDAYLRLRPYFVPESPNVTLQYQAVKSVSINADGRESIVVSNKEGQALVSCLSGSQYPGIPVYGFISSEATNSYDANAPAYQDIHIPATGFHDVKFTVGGSVRIVNLLTSASYDYPVTSATTTVTPAAGCYTYSVATDETHVTLPPGFYRFISLSGTQWSYYEVHYGNFSYTYYDDAGRAIATVAPKDLSTTTTQPAYTTRNTYDTSDRLLATESNDEGRSEYVYARDGRIRFSQSELQRKAGRFSYSNYDEVGRVVESGEYTQTASYQGAQFQSHLPTQVFTATQEAENSAFYNSTSDHHQTVYKAGATFVNYLTSPGDHLQFSITAPQAGSYTLQIQYATGRDQQTLNLVTNNGPATLLTFPTSGSWNTIATFTTTANLQQGANTLDLRVESTTTGYVDVDNLLISGPGTPVTHVRTVLDIVEDRTPTGGLDVSQCAQRNQVWYDLPWDGTAGSLGNDSQLNGRTQQFVVGAVAKTRNDNVTTWYSYDELGRVTWVVQDIPALGTQHVKTLDYTYDFSGNVLQVAYQQGQPDSFYHYYTYDAAQRLTAVNTSPDGVTRTLQAQYSYYLHGPLKRVQVAGNLQGVDYTYTLQGALKNINHVNQTLEPGHDSPQTNGTYKDLFALTLDYFSGDYASRNLDVMLPTNTGVATRYDGTIQGAAWRTPASPDVRRMSYAYDEKSQLQSSTYNKLGISGSAYYVSPPTVANSLREGGLTYDLNGNMLSLQRTDQTGAIKDNFSYTYKPNTNQLKEVHTGSASGSTVMDYDYDELGQLTRQRDEQGQRYLTYDVTGKTTGVYFDAAHTQPLVIFAYDDRGFRVSKTAYSTVGTTPAHTTYYVRDVAGNILAVYDKPAATGVVQRTEVPLYGSGRLGTLTHLDDGTTAGTDDYRYELTDHLGDARVVFHRPTTVKYTATMEPSQQTPDDQQFQNLNNPRTYDNSAPSGQYVTTITGVNGPKKTLSVARGDTVTFSALVRGLAGYMTEVTGPKPQAILLTVGALGTTGISAPATNTEATPAARSGLFQAIGRLGLGVSITGLLSHQRARASANQIQGNQPGISLHYRFYDTNNVLQAEGDQPISTTGWAPVSLGFRAPDAGRLELTSYLTSGAQAWFDDVSYEQTGGLIVQEQHQYAYGAPLPGLSYTVGNRRYRYGYQGQFAEHDDETGYESFELRLYNSRIGRWLNTDPEGQFNSPYVGMGNNPVSGIDPDGGFSGPGDGFFRTVAHGAKNGSIRGGTSIGLNWKALSPIVASVGKAAGRAAPQIGTATIRTATVMGAGAGIITSTSSAEAITTLSTLARFPALAGVSASLATAGFLAMALSGDTPHKEIDNNSYKIHLGTIPGYSSNPDGHSAIGFSKNSEQIQWYHHGFSPNSADPTRGTYQGYDIWEGGTSEFSSVGERTMNVWRNKKKFDFQTKNITRMQYITGNNAAKYQLNQVPGSYHSVLNSCVSNIKPVLGAAGYNVPSNIYTPQQLSQWFQTIP